MNLWDWLPLEIQEHILKFAIKQSPLKICHTEIKKRYYYNKGNTWPLPNKGREQEHDIIIQIKYNNDGLIKYKRSIYRCYKYCFTKILEKNSNYINPSKPKNRMYTVDITCSEIHKLYIENGKEYLNSNDKSELYIPLYITKN